MSINLIVATDDFGGIGYKNTLLYNIKEDMKFFKSTTTYNENGTKNICVMGKNTYESLKRPLEDRINVVLTSSHKYKVSNGVIIEHSIENIINHYNESGYQDKDVFFIGGAKVYEQAVKYCDKIYLTHIHDSSKKSDTYFDLKWLFDFEEVERETHYSEEYQCEYDFVTYVRKEDN